MLYFLLFWFIIFIDQFSKYLVISVADQLPYYFNRFTGVNFAINRGLMSGVFHSSQTWLFVMLTLAICSWVIGFGWYTHKRMLRGFMVLPEVFILSGAISNIIDRITCGGVIDFIELRYDDFVWPIFNFADASIVLGVCIMLWCSLRDNEYAQ